MDLELTRVLARICDNNDHIVALKILQVLGPVRRGGYMTVEDQVMCLSYCANRFAESNNIHFFREFVQYMPNISNKSINNPFNSRCKTFYFVIKHGDQILKTLSVLYENLDISAIKTWFEEYMLMHNIQKHQQVDSLLTYLEKHKEDLKNDTFQSVCEAYIPPPITMRSGN
jgi:hypothetical protein